MVVIFLNINERIQVNLILLIFIKNYVKKVHVILEIKFVEKIMVLNGWKVLFLMRIFLLVLNI